ncbi:hypothetical protein XENORESO_012783 [Xenotaenia resolanae]|uniref:Uncharacterized protein n=1 Tax=Xenotaenia resolanae TaxID=208358 RepID=A0ABV0X3Z4_9TELE
MDSYHHNWTTGNGLKIVFPFRSPSGGVCHFFWGTLDTGVHYGKTARCDGLANVLLENLGTCHPCGCHLDMYRQPNRSYRPGAHCHGNNRFSLMAVDSSRRILLPTV